MRTGTSLGVVLLALGLATGSPAAAAIHACPTANGGVQFQDRPCRGPAPEARAARSARGTGDAPASARSRRAPPLGIDPSWFDRPGAGGREALCDSRGCECGTLERTFETGIATAVADALYLDGAWHRYETSAMSVEHPAVTAGARRAARTELEDAACDVLMSQETLRRHAERTLRGLRRRAGHAEDLGRDTPEACDGFSEAACGDYEALLLYRRVSTDARALAAPRHSPRGSPRADIDAVPDALTK